MDRKENLRKHSQRLWRTQDKEEKSTQSGKFLPEKALLQAHLVGQPHPHPVAIDEGLPEKQNAANFPLAEWKLLLCSVLYCIL